MRDHITPINMVLQRVPKEVLEAQYKIYLPPMSSSKYTTSTFLQVFASKKGWKTGSGTPAEVHAAKVVMKDYTTGRLLHCQLRPDYDPSVHAPCKQNGYNLDLEAYDISQQNRPSAQNYEEIKEEPSEVESEATTNFGEESKSFINSDINVSPYKPPATARSAQQYMQDENDFDA